MSSAAELNIVDGWLRQAERCESPNCNERPDGTKIDLLVIHNISLPAGHYGGGYIQQLFTNCLDCSADASFVDLQGLEVSAHLLIDREGQLTQFVPFDQRAWHAGVSIFEGRDNCNDFSIGIELEGVDDSPYTEKQYRSLVQVTQCLQSCYPALSDERIVGHCDIAPQRKTDPGPAFDWRHFRQLLTNQV